MITLPVILTPSQGAVMATSPARQPLIIMLRSGLPNRSQAYKHEATVPAAAAMAVVVAMWAIAPASAAIVLPGLKPNQPSQRIKPPSAAEGHVVSRDGHCLPVFVVLAQAWSQE